MHIYALILLLLPVCLFAETKTVGLWQYNEYRSDNNHGNFIALTINQKSDNALFGVIANPDVNGCTPFLNITEFTKNKVGEGTLEVDVQLRVDSLEGWSAKDQTMFISDDRVEIYIIPDSEWNLVAELMYGKVLRVKYADWIGRFSLKGSKLAIEETVTRCLQYAKQHGDEKYFDGTPSNPASTDPDETYF